MPDKHISQIDLITAIMKHLEKQAGVKSALPREYNAIISAANIICEAFRVPERTVSHNMGLEKWLKSDHVGMSSKFMASILSGQGCVEYARPYDSEDFGRCLGLLDACPEFRKELHRMIEYSPQWERLVKNWELLESLYREDKETGVSPKLNAKMRMLLDGAEKV